jgi:hypothetical protein
MRHYLLPFLLLLTTLGNLLAQENQHFSVYFASASADLDATATAQLQGLIDQLQGMGDYRLELAAHTDSRGTSRYNDRLAQDRAESVTNFLQQQYITTDGMRTLALGEQEAGNDRNSEELQRDNRRVDVIVSGWYWQGIGSLRDSLAQPLAQKYTIDTDQDQLIEGNKGGRFFLPSTSFVNAAGEEVTGLVDVELTECYSLGDMISLGLTTTAQDRILESGGMLQINAYQNGQRLQLKPGSDIASSVPTMEYRQDMSLFYGQAHGEENPDIDWANSEAPVQQELPPLTFAPGPVRPSWMNFALTYLKQPDDEADPRFPKEHDSTRPVRPREPNYDNIAYYPRGLEKIFMGKATQEERTAEKKEQRRISYEKAIKSYEVRIANYNQSLVKHNLAMEEYKALRKGEVDEYGFINTGPLYEYLKAKADSAFASAQRQYQRDSTGYEGYRSRKLEAYERQVEALGQVDASIVSSYFFNINQMGWANIDRFLKTVPTTPLAARENTPETDASAMVFLLIPERNIILRMPYRNQVGFVLSRVPVGETAKIMAIKVQDKKAYLSSQEVIITDDLLITLDYRPGRLRDIREELAGI